MWQLLLCRIIVQWVQGATGLYSWETILRLAVRCPCPQEWGSDCDGYAPPENLLHFFYLKWHDSVHLEWHCWQNICLQDVVTMTPRTLAGWQCKPPSCFVHSHTSFVQNRCANDSQLKISRKQTGYWLTWICNSGRWFASSAELPIIFHKPLRKWVTKVERD